MIRSIASLDSGAIARDRPALADCKGKEAESGWRIICVN